MIPGKNGGWLKPYPKGVSGNPGGLPRPYQDSHRRFANMSARALRRLIPDDLTVAEAEVRRVKMRAMRGDIRAAIESADRTEGKVPLSLTGPGGEALIPARISLTEEASRLLAAIEGRQKA